MAKAHPPSYFLAPGPRRKRLGLWLLTGLTQLALAAILLALYLARWPTDMDLLGFLVLLGPRFAFLLPFLLLVPWAMRRRAHWLLAEQLLGIALCCGPLMGLNWAGLAGPSAAQAVDEANTIRILSYNIGPNGFQVDRLVDYLNQQKIEILVVQEDTDIWKLKARLAADKGWYWNRYSTIFSRLPIVSESNELPDEAGGDKLYAGHLTLARVRRGSLDFIVGSAHGPSLRGAFYKLVKDADLAELRKALDWQKRQLARIALMMDQNEARPLVVGGDFNVPPGSVYAAPLEKRFEDVYARLGTGWGYTFPTRLPWLRLDKFYLSRGWQPLRCFVATDFGSDHRPLFTEIQLLETAATEKQAAPAE